MVTADQKQGRVVTASFVLDGEHCAMLKALMTAENLPQYVAVRRAVVAGLDAIAKREMVQAAA